MKATDTTESSLSNPGSVLTTPGLDAVPAKEPWVSKRTLSKHLEVSTRWVERRVAEGMPFFPLGNQPRFKISVVEAWIAQGAER
jgi:hypothetical protein